MNKIIEKFHRISNAMLKELMASLIAVAIVTTGAIFIYAGVGGTTGGNYSSWSPGGAPKAAPGVGNVATLWNWNGEQALTAMKDITRLVFNNFDGEGMFWIKNGPGESAKSVNNGGKGNSIIGWNDKYTGDKDNQVAINANVRIGTDTTNPNVGPKNLHVYGDLTVDGKINGAGGSSLVGGGSAGAQDSCSAWGKASCNGSSLICPIGSSKYDITGGAMAGDAAKGTFLCVTD